MNINDDTRYQISISLTNTKDVLEMNKKYRGKDVSTDVLSFRIDKDLGDKEHYLGDIIVNKEMAVKQAQERGHSVEEELSELVKHGVLHLLEVHHEGDDN